MYKTWRPKGFLTTKVGPHAVSVKMLIAEQREIRAKSRWLSNPLFDNFRNIPARRRRKARGTARKMLKLLHFLSRVAQVFAPGFASLPQSNFANRTKLLTFHVGRPVGVWTVNQFSRLSTRHSSRAYFRSRSRWCVLHLVVFDPFY